MKKLALLALLATLPLTANFCDGDYYLGAELLYFRPVACAWDYGQNSTAEGESIRSIKGDNDWGFRITGGLTHNCSFFEASYLWLQTRDGIDAGTVDALYGAPLFNTTNTKVHLNYNYQNVDLRFGQVLHQARGCNFAVYGNGRWVDLEQERSASGTSNANPVHVRYNGKFNGAGLGVGIRGDFCLFNSFSVWGNLATMGIIGERKTECLCLDITGNQVIAHYADHTCVVPALDLRLGVDYAWQCGGVDTLWCVGYEVDYYWKAINTVDEQINDTRTCKDLGFSGPFAGVMVLF